MNGILASAVRDGKFVVTAECRPPRGTSTDRLKAYADVLGGLVHAIGASESEDGVRMSSLAACSHLLSAGAEPILSLLTRDLNRIALQATILGAASMGIRNVLCMSGRHQALTTSGAARGVFDVDPIQLIGIGEAIRKEGRLADGLDLESPVDLLVGMDANPFSDPMELQVMALDRAVSAGADFVMTEPVYNTGRFSQWIASVRERGIHDRTCIIASVMPLISAEEAMALSTTYRHLDVPEEAIRRLDNSEDPRAEGIGIAVETIGTLRKTDGVRGIHVIAHEDPALAAEVLRASGLSGS
jgi:methylenetetrahydrofolate reductase (NADPH)